MSTRVTINSINMDTLTMSCIKYNKDISCLVVIGSSLQQLRTELIESGSDLRELLKKPFPNADAVLAAVEEIHNVLYREGIPSVWVTARVDVEDGCRYITNRKVHAVSVLFSLCLNCT